MSEPPPSSPCIRHCCLDAADICLGCGRSLQEILDWHAADPARRQAILRCAAERRAQRQQRFSDPAAAGPEAPRRGD